MSAALTIAARDFRAYFSTMKGAAIFFFFLGFMSLFFYSFVTTFLEMQQKAPMYGGEAPTLEQLLRALFYNFHFILILIVPAITMSSFSEEKRNQSIRLLQTSPVSATQIVFGKFLAAVLMVGAVMMASVAYPLFTVKYGNPDIGVIFTSYMGLFLLMCGQIAFGLWISSMTNNQFMAFIFTMLGLFLLMIMNWIAPNISGTGVMESVFKYIASTDHLDSFFKGIISVKSLTYFVCMIGMFLFFTNAVLDSQRWR